MNKNLDLLQEFEDWMGDNRGFTLRQERFDRDLSNCVHNPLMTAVNRMEIMTEWLRSAYMAGARTLAQDSLDTLRDYATVVAGCETPLRNPAQGYDAAADNLHAYYTQVLNPPKN